MVLSIVIGWLLNKHVTQATTQNTAQLAQTRSWYSTLNTDQLVLRIRSWYSTTINTDQLVLRTRSWHLTKHRSAGTEYTQLAGAGGENTQDSWLRTRQMAVVGKHRGRGPQSVRNVPEVSPPLPRAGKGGFIRRDKATIMLHQVNSDDRVIHSFDLGLKKEIQWVNFVVCLEKPSLPAKLPGQIPSTGTY